MHFRKPRKNRCKYKLQCRQCKLVNNGTKLDPLQSRNLKYTLTVCMYRCNPGSMGRPHTSFIYTQPCQFLAILLNEHLVYPGAPGKNAHTKVPTFFNPSMQCTVRTYCMYIYISYMFLLHTNNCRATRETRFTG